MLTTIKDTGRIARKMVKGLSDLLMAQNIKEGFGMMLHMVLVYIKIQ